MTIAAQDLKDIASKILTAVDTSEISAITELLELKVVDKNLYISVTNSEYHVQVRLYLGYEEDLHATVNANLFLKLVSQITTEDITLTVKGNYLYIEGNGKYKLPLVFDGDQLLKLPLISIENKTCDMYIDSEILRSILRYNSRELLKGAVSRPVQRFYYVDEKGAITFTTGACVNNFTLEKPIRLLLSGKVVKLFKLFTNGDVHFTLGYDPISDEIIQTKVMFESADTILTAILSCDDTMLNSVPVKAIRGRAEGIYPYTISINKEVLLQAINRLLLFNSKKDAIQPLSTFKFSTDNVVLYDRNKENSEVVKYNNECTELSSGYEALVDLNDIKATLETCNDQHLTISFGDSTALVIAKTNIKIVVPECIVGTSGS